MRPYSPEEAEDGIYKKWTESGFFNPDICVEKGVVRPDAPTYSIVLPPPNVTGTLHMGHAAMLAVEDILVRYHRMKGYRTLWIPGTDSAAIATQSKVEKQLYKTEKKSRHDVGREPFLEMVHAYAMESHDTIVNQLKKMGSSLDWSREAYTLDETRTKAVNTAFVRMYEAGLIYRGHRTVNWDPKMQTTVSDDEVDYIEQTDPFYYLKYGPFTIGTVRPETKFGDKYVVMHPDDTRYKEYAHGQQIELEWINGPIVATIIKDEAADMEMGSGVMTITPWHSAVDFEIAERHGLDKEQIIDERGILLPIAGEFAGEHIKKARARIVEKLESKGLVERVDDKYVHNIATNSRGGGTIEPQIKEQWFIDVDKPFTPPQGGPERTLREWMRSVVDDGSIRIIPDNQRRIYLHWVENLRPWCISRQIWFGHRIPVWYKGDEIVVGLTAPSGDGWEQDPDTLDTWFSSGLWTFSTLGWPNMTSDLKDYHPTSLLETGYDILFFWVARMVLMSGFLMGEVPFRDVYLHGLVRDEKGRKMSKSLDNIINPLDMIAKYGADATRLSLIVGAAAGSDIKLSEDKVRGYKKFTNKVWNIARFILTQTEGLAPNTNSISAADSALIAEFDEIAQDVTKDIEEYRLYMAAEKVYHYAWHRLADVILEEAKPVLSGTDAAAAESRKHALYELLVRLLKLLHPFAPFVTEEIWQSLPHKDSELLLVAAWPCQHESQ